MNLAGDTLPDVLSTLDATQSKSSHLFKQPEPISFWISDLTEDSLILHYASEQEGLAPMVVGFVRGLCKLIDTECSIIQVGFKGETSEHDEFAVAFEKIGVFEDRRLQTTRS